MTGLKENVCSVGLILLDRFSSLNVLFINSEHSSGDVSETDSIVVKKVLKSVVMSSGVDADSSPFFMVLGQSSLDTSERSLIDDL